MVKISICIMRLPPELLGHRFCVPHQSINHQVENHVMEKLSRRLVVAGAVFCSSAFADIETVDVFGTPITYEYMSFEKWSKQPQELTGGGGAQVMGSAYSNYRAGVAKAAYCSKIHAERDRCDSNVLDVHAAGTKQCTTSVSYTTTAQIGADGKIVNGTASVTFTFDNKDDCYRVTDAYRDAALADCKATLSEKKSQAQKYHFCY